MGIVDGLDHLIWMTPEDVTTRSKFLGLWNIVVKFEDVADFQGLFGPCRADAELELYCLLGIVDVLDEGTYPEPRVHHLYCT